MTASSMAPPGVASRLAQKLMKEEPTRHPSPQPTHFSMNTPYLAKANGNGHRVLRSATVGYVAPEFTGKAEQMKEGEPAVENLCLGW
jgi:glutamate dehydrogenase